MKQQTIEFKQMLPNLVQKSTQAEHSKTKKLLARRKVLLKLTITRGFATNWSLCAPLYCCLLLSAIAGGQRQAGATFIGTATAATAIAKTTGEIISGQPAGVSVGPIESRDKIIDYNVSFCYCHFELHLRVLIVGERIFCNRKVGKRTLSRFSYERGSLLKVKSMRWLSNGTSGALIALYLSGR